MKKVVFVSLMIALIMMVYTQDEFLWCKRLFLDAPIVHVVERGEYLSQLSQEYYGSPWYWKELALINRAPNPDLVFPGESIMIPDLGAVKQLKKARSISSVSKLVRSLEETLAQNRIKLKADLTSLVEKKKDAKLQNPKKLVQAKVKPAEKNQLAEPNRETKASSSLPAFALVAGGIALLVFSVIFIRKRHMKKKSLAVFESDGEMTEDGEIGNLERTQFKAKSRKKQEVLANENC